MGRGGGPSQPFLVTILVPSVPSDTGLGQVETDFLATSDQASFRRSFP